MVDGNQAHFDEVPVRLPLTYLPLEQRDRLRVGALFRWVIVRLSDGSGSTTTRSQIDFLPHRSFSEAEQRDIDARAKSLLALLDEGAKQQAD